MSTPHTDLIDPPRRPSEQEVAQRLAVVRSVLLEEITAVSARTTRTTVSSAEKADSVSRGLTPGRSTPLVTHRETLTDRRPLRHRLRGQRRLVVTLAVGGTALALSAGAWAVQRATQDDISYSATCYSADDTKSASTIVGIPQATDTTTGQSSRENINPTAQCASMWRMGIIGQPQVPDDPNAANFPVPDLIACVQPDGTAAVFPRGSDESKLQCADLGMAAWQ